MDSTNFGSSEEEVKAASEERTSSHNVSYEDIKNKQFEALIEESSDVLYSDELMSQSLSNFDDEKTKLFDIYKIIVDTRKFEIENFWKRTAFFWGVLAIILVGYFNAKNSEEYLIFISYLGFFYNLIFSLSLRGSKYWQVHWEIAAIEHERHLGFKIFRWNFKDKIKEESSTVFPPLKPTKYSVSKLTMILSDFTIFFWLILMIKDFVYMFKNSLLHFDFCAPCKELCVIDWYTCGVITIPLIGILYLIVFISNSLYGHDMSWKKFFPDEENNIKD